MGFGYIDPVKTRCLRPAVCA